jgi:hypothetical protein
MRISYRILLGKLKWKTDHLENLGKDGRIILKSILIEHEDADWMNWTMIFSKEPSCSIKGWEFLNHLSD